MEKAHSSFCCNIHSEGFDLDFDLKAGLLQLYQEASFSEKLQDLSQTWNCVHLLASQQATESSFLLDTYQTFYMHPIGNGCLGFFECT